MGLSETGTRPNSPILRTNPRTFSGPVPFWQFHWTYPYDFTHSSSFPLQRKTRHSSAEGRRERSSAAAESPADAGPSTRAACESKRYESPLFDILTVGRSQH